MELVNGMKVCFIYSNNIYFGSVIRKVEQINNKDVETFVIDSEAFSQSLYVRTVDIFDVSVAGQKEALVEIADRLATQLKQKRQELDNAKKLVKDLEENIERILSDFIHVSF